MTSIRAVVGLNRKPLFNSGRRRTVALYLLGIISAISLAFALNLPAALAQPAPPNIVFILADDQGWNGTSVQMDPAIADSRSDFYQTPNLEALAARGMRFSNAYAAPMCSSTRAAIQTGKSPAQLQMTDVHPSSYPSSQYNSFFVGQTSSPPLVRGDLAAEENTVAEWLDQNNSGYVTAHFGKWHISYPEAGKAATRPIYGYDFENLTAALPADQDSKLSFRVAATGMQFMEQRVAANQPFFMQLSYAAPHAPYEARPETLAKYQALPPGERHTNPLYAAMTEDLDTSVGQVLQKIRDLGIEDNTYIFYSSDNGAIALLGANESTPLYHSKGTVYEGGVRVPMIVAGPNVAAGAVSSIPVTLQDIFATTSALAGISTPVNPDVESANLTPLLHNGGILPEGMTSLTRGYAPGGELFYHMPHHYSTTVFGPRVPASAIRDGDFKLVKVYGVNGQPDKVLLFNLAANVTESDDPNSPLNLASAMPQKTSHLLGKLDRWLQDVDASLPYNMSQQVALHWDASHPGTVANTWRSVNDVDVKLRETWELLPAQNRPTIANVAPFQPGLGGNAFHFDGNDAMKREFFRTSDSKTPSGTDSDRSASIDLWLRTDDLNASQTVFESGDGGAGISLTLGSGELRFRVLGKTGASLVASTPINRFADATADFVYATAVFNDAPANRFVEIYLNGALASRVDGPSGAANTLEWDAPGNSGWTTFFQAGLGGAVGEGSGAALGANGGTGPLPFAGYFRGDVAMLAFYNYPIGANVVADNYNAMLDAPNLGISALSGQAFSPLARPSSVALGKAESSSLAVIEERHHQLRQSILMDAVVQGGSAFTASSPLSSGVLPAGSEFTSYLMHFDPIGANSAPVNVVGSLTFGQEILGLMLNSNSLAATDSILGSIGDYGLTSDRGLQLAGSDSITISSDRRSLTFNLTTAPGQLTQFRVLTNAPAPGDFDGDGIVDGLDLASWSSAFGATAAGDADGDGDSDGNDFLIWQRRIGVTNVVAITQPVPEPSSSVLGLVALIASLTAIAKNRN